MSLENWIFFIMTQSQHTLTYWFNVSHCREIEFQSKFLETFQTKFFKTLKLIFEFKFTKTLTKVGKK